MSTQDDQDLLRRLAGAKPLSDYGDRLRPGRHRLALNLYETRNTEKRGKIVASDLIVLESQAGVDENGQAVRPHIIGEVAGVAWFIDDKGWEGDREASRSVDFVKKLLMIDDNVAAASEAVKLRATTQPGRGYEIIASVKAKKSKKTGNVYNAITWEAVPGQSQQSVYTNRQRLEASHPIVGGQTQTPAAATPQPAPVAQPAALIPLPAGWPANAPVPPGFYNPAAVAPPVVAAPALQPLPAGWPPGAPVPPGYYNPADVAAQPAPTGLLAQLPRQ